MEINKLSVKIAGPAGEGILSAGHVLAKCCSRGGLYVVTENERPSLIRGGHNQFMVRVEDVPIGSHINLVNILLALDEQSVRLHAGELAHGGAILYDSDVFAVNPGMTGRDDLRLVPIPMHTIMKEIGATPVVTNVIALAGCLALVDYDLDILLTILKEEYSRHPAELEMDLKAALAGYDFVRKMGGHFTNALKPIRDAPKRMLINGLEALNLGMVKAGVSFVAQYPMTPSTGVIQGLAGIAEQYRIAVVQSEDEIASLNLAIGAASAGVRAITATSGGGFALMNEALSLAGNAEVGVVIVEVQRGGPATGLPTRTEQSDLKFVLNSGHGEFPLVVIAPSTPDTCYVEAQRACNLAEKFQTPVVLLLDRHNAETYHTLEALPPDLPIDRGMIVSQRDLDERAASGPGAHMGNAPFARYSWDDQSGVSKRSLPGMRNGLFIASGNEHDIWGQSADDRAERTRMMDKRLRKMRAILAELPPPTLDGPTNAGLTIVSWGSTKPIIDDARAFLARDGIRTNHLHLTYLQPFHTREVTDILQQLSNVVVVENNATGQLASLIREQTGITITKHVLQYDGWPFAPEVLAARLRTLL